MLMLVWQRWKRSRKAIGAGNIRRSARVGGATGNRSYPIRRIICTTNAIEALNAKLRRAVRTRGHFPGNEAAMKRLYLILNQAADA